MPLTHAARRRNTTRTLPEVLALLGAGGMGEVYKARDGRLDRWWQPKLSTRRPPGVLRVRQRFEREARAVPR